MGPTIIIVLDEERGQIDFRLENCDHRQAQEMLLATVTENHRQLMIEMDGEK